MPTYQLQIKQGVDYPRCRIYRQFVRFLMAVSYTHLDVYKRQV